MNGFTLLVLLAATGQIGSEPQRDYGWQIHPTDGKLEYIIQISPKDVRYMVEAGKEKPSSTVPPEIAARLTRIVVRISDEPIVSTPIEEVRRLPVVTTAVLANIEADAGRGRFSDLESATQGDVRNVSGGITPPLTPGGALPNAMPPNSTALPPSSLSANSMPSNSMQAGSMPSTQPSTLPSTLPATLPPDLSSVNSAEALARAAEAARAPESLLAQNTVGSANGSLLSQLNTPGSLPTSTAPPVGAPNSQMSGAPLGSASSRLPGSQVAGSQIGGSQVAGSGMAALPYSTSPPSTYTNTPNANPAYPATPSYQPTPNYAANQGYAGVPAAAAAGNFGALARNPTNSTYNPYATSGTPGASVLTSGTAAGGAGYGYSANPFSNTASPYATDPYSLPSTSTPVRMADSRAAIVPTTTGAGLGATGSANSGLTRSGDPYATYGESNFGAQAQRSGVENIVPVMFVLSLVVNFYLGMLIRKLLTRYRSLLSSVRSQTA